MTNGEVSESVGEEEEEEEAEHMVFYASDSPWSKNSDNQKPEKGHTQFQIEIAISGFQ